MRLTRERRFILAAISFASSVYRAHTVFIDFAPYLFRTHFIGKHPFKNGIILRDMRCTRDEIWDTPAARRGRHGGIFDAHDREL